MRICIWTMLPNHYQSSFHGALRARGVDLRVCYYERVTEDRVALGWNRYDALPDGETYVPKSPAAFDAVADWRQRVHVVPGCSVEFTRMLATRLSTERVAWAHWSEPARPGLRWWAGLPRKWWYARLVNRAALGAFGIGRLAMDDFVRWGVRRERVAFLPYSPPLHERPAAPDDQVLRFAAGRLPFVFIGSLSHRKGIDILLRAFANLGTAGSRTVLVLVGSDDSGGVFARQALALGVGDRVLFRGTVKSEAVPAMLAAGAVCVLPSRFDGWGVVLNEAASMGLALIGSDRAGASHHLIRPAQNGFLVRAGRVASLTAAMQTYAAHPEVAVRHGELSRRVSEDYTADRNADRFVRAIETWTALRG